MTHFVAIVNALVFNVLCLSFPWHSCPPFSAVVNTNAKLQCHQYGYWREVRMGTRLVRTCMCTGGQTRSCGGVFCCNGVHWCVVVGRQGVLVVCFVVTLQHDVVLAYIVLVMYSCLHCSLQLASTTTAVYVHMLTYTWSVCMFYTPQRSFPCLFPVSKVCSLHVSKVCSLHFVEAFVQPERERCAFSHV